MAVVVSYVPGPPGAAALQAGLQEARLRGARVVVLNTSRGDSLVDSRFVQGAALEELRAQLADSGLAYEIRQPVRGGDIVDEVVDVVAEVGADLVVIGLRKRSAVGKLLLGSAAQRLLLEVPCPVLAVKAS
ncbi:MAG TPA: universal stress protein [Mycobacteriales bacterium]|jgi:nucleotide-binding universal stress UspA family protein|nr:universal stress protein [Mycobacteriales bacterium]